MAVAPIPPIAVTAPTSAPAGTAATERPGAFAAGLQQVADLQGAADLAATKVATGDAADLHQFMAAASKASLAMELTVAVRDKAVEAYQEIMRMQV